MAIIGFDSGGTAPRRFPNDGTWNRLTLQPSFRVSNTAAGIRVSIEWAGAVDSLLELMDSERGLQPGATSLPASCGVSLGGRRIILETAEISGEEGGTAAIRAEYRERNERETDDDVADGLQSRRVGMRWVERQETLEHYVARVKTDESGTFNGALFALWLQEPDPEAKAAFWMAAGRPSRTIMPEIFLSGFRLRKLIFAP